MTLVLGAASLAGLALTATALLALAAAPSTHPRGGHAR